MTLPDTPSAPVAGESAPTSFPQPTQTPTYGEALSAQSTPGSTHSNADEWEYRLAQVRALKAQRRLENRRPRGPKKEKPETGIQRRIMERMEQLPYLRLERNNRGVARGHVRFGLGDGAADLVGVVTMTGAHRGVGRYFGLEIKIPGAKPEAHQLQWAADARALGAYVGCATSTEEALACVEEARSGADLTKE